MSGLQTRQSIWLKLWFTSIHSICLMLMVPLGIYIINMFQLDSIRSYSSFFYEKFAVIWYVFILHWCFSIDFDTKFHVQLITYHLKRWKIICERILFASLVFYSSLIIITITHKFFLFELSWISLIFSIPVYVGITGVMVLSTVIGNHSLGGLFVGLILWIISLNGGGLLLYLNPVLLEFPNVYNLVVYSNLTGSNNNWILYNRLFYFSLGILLTAYSLIYFHRKSF